MKVKGRAFATFFIHFDSLFFFFEKFIRLVVAESRLNKTPLTVESCSKSPLVALFPLWFLFILEQIEFRKKNDEVIQVKQGTVTHSLLLKSLEGYSTARGLRINMRDKKMIKTLLQQHKIVETFYLIPMRTCVDTKSQ